MNSIAKIYKTKFKERLSPYGFSLYRKTFYRLVNDVVQTLMLVNVDSDYTVAFGIYPLFLGFDDLCEVMDGPGVHDFRQGNFQNQDKYWTIRNTLYGIRLSDEELEKYVVDEMLSLAMLHVIPMFERGTDWKSGTDEINNYWEAVHGNVLRSSYHENFFLYIKAGEYEKAIPPVQKLIKQRQFNPYCRLNQIKIREQHLQNLKLDHELGMSDNYQQTKLDILSREDVSSLYKEELTSRELFFETYNTPLELSKTPFASIALQLISNVEGELEQLKDIDSPLSKSIKAREMDYTENSRKIIERYNDLLMRLSIPDVEYFDNLFAENEAKAREYLSNPRKYKQKHGY